MFRVQKIVLRRCQKRTQQISRRERLKNKLKAKNTVESLHATIGKLQIVMDCVRNIGEIVILMKGVMGEDPSINRFVVFPIAGEKAVAYIMMACADIILIDRPTVPYLVFLLPVTPVWRLLLTRIG